MQWISNAQPAPIVLSLDEKWKLIIPLYVRSFSQWIIAPGLQLLGAMHRATCWHLYADHRHHQPATSYKLVLPCNSSYSIPIDWSFVLKLHNWIRCHRFTHTEFFYQVVCLRCARTGIGSNGAMGVPWTRSGGRVWIDNSQPQSNVAFDLWWRIAWNIPHSCVHPIRYDERWRLTLVIVWTCVFGTKHYNQVKLNVFCVAFLKKKLHNNWVTSLNFFELLIVNLVSLTWSVAEVAKTPPLLVCFIRALTYLTYTETLNQLK